MSTDIELKFKSLMERLRESDRPACLEMAREWSREGMDDRVFYVDLLLRSLVEIGRLWERNGMNIAEEHAATDIVRQMIILRASLDGPREAEKGDAIVGCVPYEMHDIPALILSNLLEKDGWRVRFFGADVPKPDIVEMALKTRPDIACFTVKTLPRLESAVELFNDLRTASPGTRIIVGGVDSPSLRAVLEAQVDAFADCPLSAVKKAGAFARKVN